MLRLGRPSIISRLAVLPYFPRHVSGLTHRRQDKCEKTPGCFGLPGLHDARDWDTIAKSCVRDCVDIADSIRAQSSAPSPTILQLFDDLSDRLCSVLDTAELCRNVHPNLDYVQAADEAYVHVSSVIDHLNADTSIYEPLEALHERHHRARKSHADARHVLHGEDLVMVNSLKDDFERGGMKLHQSEKNRLIKLQQQVNALASSFTSIETGSTRFAAVEAAKLYHVPGNLIASSEPSRTKPGYVDVPLTPTNTQLLLKWTNDSAVREKVYRQAHHYDVSKSMTLDALLSKRREIAHILGHDSYAQLLFSNRLASSPSAVSEFLERLSRLVWEPAVNERNSLEGAKLRCERNISTLDSSIASGWDRSYYIGKLKAEDFNLSSSNVSQHFPLHVCLTALSDIVKQVFGIQLRRVSAAPSEVWHEDVEKLEVVDENGSTIGHIFLDLYPRENKYTHSAHFSITSGRQPLEQSDYQTPVVALVCNFGVHQHMGERLLTMSEYETLFHEFGHSLHSILSRTKYQHLSGTRVATDLVEVPSHLLEHFAWDERVISKYARHFQTGEAMPTKVVRSLCASRRAFMATDVQMQALFSAMDLDFHGEAPPIGETTAAFERLQRKLTAYEPDEGVAVPLTFHHFVGYGAGYYSYVFARVMSAQIWRNLFERDVFSREGGDKLRHGLLAVGASREGADVFEEVMGGDVTCEAFLKAMNVDIGKESSGLRLPIANRI